MLKTMSDIYNIAEIVLVGKFVERSWVLSQIFVEVAGEDNLVVGQNKLLQIVVKVDNELFSWVWIELALGPKDGPLLREGSLWACRGYVGLAYLIGRDEGERI